MVAAKYCQLIPQETKAVSVFWKLSHIVCLFVAGVSSFNSALQSELISVQFGNHCMLYPTLEFVPKEKSLYELVGDLPLNDSYHTPQTIWGNPMICSFCRGSYLFSMTLAFILQAFFIIVPKGGAAPTQFMYSEAWHLVPLAISMATIMLIFVTVAYTHTHLGMRSLVTQLTNYLVNNNICDPGSCTKEIDLFSLIYFPEVKPLTRYFTILNVASTSVLLSWIALIVSLSIRIVLGIDFKVIIYKIRAIPPADDTNSSISETSYNLNDDIPVMEKQSYVNIRSFPSNVYL